MIYKIPHGKQKIEQDESNLRKNGVNSGDSEW